MNEQHPTRGDRIRLTLSLAGILALAGPASGAINWSIQLQNPSGPIAPYAAQLTNTLFAAGAEWDQHLGGSASIEVQVGMDASISTASGRSATSGFMYHNGQYNVWEQGAAREIRMGVDLNGSAADIEIMLAPGYLTNELWFDPDPWSRSMPVPWNKVDAFSVMLHELGHAIGFNGWRDRYTGTIGPYGSTFDEQTAFDGSDFFFTGQNAVRVYGDPVPLTYGNIFHLGNRLGRPGSDLGDDLMNGLSFDRGTKYGISALDLAILDDSGVPITSDYHSWEVPSSGPVGLTLVSATMLVWRRRR